MEVITPTSEVTSAAKYYLCLNYGHIEGWELTPYDTLQLALDAASKETSFEWKILKEVTVKEVQ